MIEDLRLHFLCGITTGLRFGVEPRPVAFRGQQRALVELLGPQLAGWTVKVPERYADSAADSRTEDAVQLRVWDSNSIGTTRLPVGLLRLTRDLEAQVGPDAGVAGTALVELLLWADGSGVMVASLEHSFPEPVTPARARHWVDETTFGRLDDELQRSAQDVLDVLVSRLAEAGEWGGDVDGEVSVRYVGRHRLVHLDLEPSTKVIDAVGRAMNAGALDQQLVDVSTDPSRYAAPANGVSVEISRLGTCELLPVARYYQRWIAAVTRLDDDLYEDVVALSRSARASKEHVNVRTDARQLLSEHRDVLNALTPLHSTAWSTYASSWRIAELVADVLEKAAAVDELNGELRQALGNRIAARTGAVVTFLTALTLVSIVTGIAAFVLQDNGLSAPARWSLVGASLLAALTLFLLSIQPLLLRRADRKAAVG